MKVKVTFSCWIHKWFPLKSNHWFGKSLVGDLRNCQSHWRLSPGVPWTFNIHCISYFPSKQWSISSLVFLSPPPRALTARPISDPPTSRTHFFISHRPSKTTFSLQVAQLYEIFGTTLIQLSDNFDKTLGQLWDRIITIKWLVDSIAYGHFLYPCVSPPKIFLSAVRAVRE